MRYLLYVLNSYLIYIIVSYFFNIFWDPKSVHSYLIYLTYSSNNGLMMVLVSRNMSPL